MPLRSGLGDCWPLPLRLPCAHVARYGRLSYQDKSEEYPRTQQIGEVAHFLEFDGLIVPSARYGCQNAVLFGDRVPPEAMAVVRDHGLIDWTHPG